MISWFLFLILRHKEEAYQHAIVSADLAANIYILNSTLWILLSLSLVANLPRDFTSEITIVSLGGDKEYCPNRQPGVNEAHAGRSSSRSQRASSHQQTLSSSCPQIRSPFTHFCFCSQAAASPGPCQKVVFDCQTQQCLKSRWRPVNLGWTTWDVSAENSPAELERLSCGRACFLS